MNVSIESQAIEGSPPDTTSVMGRTVSPLEVVPRARRRTFTFEYKARILREADSLDAIPGGIGELLRREGLYSSHLTHWRRTAQEGALKQLGQARGRKPKSVIGRENEQLHRRIAQLEENLRKAEIIIDVQKKVAMLLGNSTPEAPKAP